MIMNLHKITNIIDIRFNINVIIIKTYSIIFHLYRINILDFNNSIVFINILT